MIETDVQSAKLAESNSLVRGTSPCDASIQKLTVDFESVHWVSSQGLNELISINRIAKTRGIRLILANVQEPVR